MSTTDTQQAPETTAAPVVLTDAAVNAVKNIIKDEGLDASKVRLRVGVKGGGCSGFSYILDLTENQRDSDEAFEINGIVVICDPKSLLYLNGTQVDYKDEMMAKGFVFENPNASSTCGCGSSFSA